MRIGWLTVAAALVFGCATGASVDDTGYQGAAGQSDGGSGGNGGSVATGGSWATGGTSATGGSSGTGATGGASGGSGGSGATGGTGASGGTGATGGTGGTGASGGTGGTGGTGGCGTPNTCTAAVDLGTVSGDTGNGSVNHSGRGSTFMKLRVTENDSNPLGKKLNLTVALTVPSTADYDLYAYVNTTSDVSPCGMSPNQKSELGTGQAEQVKLTWGEGTPANGVDDSRTVVIEVRYKSGACGSSDTWSLIATGNT